MKWKGIGHFTSDEHDIYYCGLETLKRNEVAFICNNKLRKYMMSLTQ